MSSCQSIVVCSNLMHYCGVNFTSLQNWCDCLIANYGSSCRDETLVNYFTFIFQNCTGTYFLNLNLSKFFSIWSRSRPHEVVRYGVRTMPVRYLPVLNFLYHEKKEIFLIDAGVVEPVQS